MKSFLKHIIMPFFILFIACYIISTISGDSFNIGDDFVLKYEKLIYLVSVALVFLLIVLPPMLSKLIKPKYQRNILFKNTSTEFDNMYNSLYGSNISSLEEMRRKAKIRRTIVYILSGIVVIGLIFAGYKRTLMSSTVDLVISIVSVIAIISVIILELFNYSAKKEYIKTYKKNIVSNFIKLVSDDLTYEPDNVNSASICDDYKNANFDNKSFNEFKSDDHIEGNVEDNIYIKLDDILVQKISARYTREEESKVVFQGIFGCTKTNKDINTCIKVTRNKYSLFKDETKVGIDNSNFEEIFDVYAENRILAMRIFTSDITNCLIDFYNKYQLDFEVVLKDNNIYLRFFTGAMFEPKIFGNSMDKELLAVYYSILKFVVDITKLINLTVQEIDI